MTQLATVYDKTLESVVPSHFIDSYPTFYEFLQEAARFIEHKARQLRIERQKDIFGVSDQLIGFLHDELAKRFPGALIDERKFLRYVRDLYKIKGTFDSFQFLFSLFFNEVIQIDYPKRYLFTPSVNKYRRLLFVDIEFDTLSEYNGVIDGLFAERFYFAKITREPTSDGVFSGFSVSVDLAEVIDSNDRIMRVYVDLNNLHSSERESKFIQWISELERLPLSFEYTDDGEVVAFDCVPRIRQTVHRIVLNSAGERWLRGQLIRIPGLYGRDTIIRVESVDAKGSITSWRVVQYGVHDPSESLFLLYPFDISLITNEEWLTRELVGLDSTGNPIYHWTAKLKDNIYHRETAFGYDYNVSSMSYFLEPVVEDGYFVGNIRFSYTHETTPSSSSTSSTTTSFTYVSVPVVYFSDDVVDDNYFAEEYEIVPVIDTSASTLTLTPDEIDERLTIQYSDMDILNMQTVFSFDRSRNYGTYSYYDNQDDLYEYGNSRLNTEDSIIQDSDYYQLFSYVLMTTFDLREIRQAIDRIHPAGFRRFVETNLTIDSETEFTDDFDVNTYFTIDDVYLLTIADVEDSVRYDFEKILQEPVIITDERDDGNSLYVENGYVEDGYFDLNPNVDIYLIKIIDDGFNVADDIPVEYVESSYFDDVYIEGHPAFIATLTTLVYINDSFEATDISEYVENNYFNDAYIDSQMINLIHVQPYVEYGYWDDDYVQ